MFGRGKPDFRKLGNAPDWAKALMRQHAPSVKLVWHDTKRRKQWDDEYCTPDELAYRESRVNAYGCAWITFNTIEVFSNTREQTKRTLLVMLHEIAHMRKPQTEKRGKGTTYHGPIFWREAFRLYREHGIAAYAADFESYASGRKYGKALLSRIASVV